VVRRCPSEKSWYIWTILPYEQPRRSDVAKVCADTSHHGWNHRETAGSCPYLATSQICRDKWITRHSPGRWRCLQRPCRFPLTVDSYKPNASPRLWTRIQILTSRPDPPTKNAKGDFQGQAHTEVPAKYAVGFRVMVVVGERTKECSDAVGAPSLSCVHLGSRPFWAPQWCMPKTASYRDSSTLLL
jgi:hypothetical protein